MIASHFSNWIFLLFVSGIPLYGAYKKVNVFETFIGGAKEGLQICVSLVPYLIAMLVAIGMLRASGFFDLMARFLSPILSTLGISPELLPLALIRPFSGSASIAITSDLATHFGGDSLIAKTAATLMGSTETTFYVIAVYFGAVGIQKTRYAIPAGLMADLAGVIASIALCNYFFG